MNCVKDVIAHFIIACLGAVNWLVIFEIISQSPKKFYWFPGIIIGIFAVLILYFVIIPIIFFYFTLEKGGDTLFLKKWAAEILGLENYLYCDVCTVFGQYIKFFLLLILYPILFVFGTILFVIGFVGNILIGNLPKVDSFFCGEIDEIFSEVTHFNIGWFYAIVGIYLFFRGLGWIINNKYLDITPSKILILDCKKSVVIGILFFIIVILSKRDKVIDIIKKAITIILNLITAIKRHLCRRVVIKDN